MTKNNISLGRILKQRRHMAELTLSQLSAMSGVSASYLGRIENGERYPSASILQRIAKPLGIVEIELLSSAGFLSPQSSTGVESLNGGGLDPYVASVLSQEPVEVQRAVLTIISVFKYVGEARSHFSA